MKNTISILLIMVSMAAFGQDAEQTIKGTWTFSNQLGFTQFTVTNNFSINATAYGGVVGYEFNLNNQFNLTTGISYDRFNGDFYSEFGQNQNMNSTFIGIPVLFGISRYTNDYFGFYIKGGVYGMYLIDSNIRIESLDRDVDFDSNGFNFGLQANLGVLVKLSKRASINMGFSSRSDLFQSYSASNSEVSLKNYYAFEFGLRIQSK